MEGLVAAEAIDIEVSGTAGFVGQVKADAPVETDDEEVEVVADADAGADGELAEEILQTERAGGVVGLVGVVVGRRPYVAGIEEEGAVEVAEELAAVFEVADELVAAVAHEVVGGVVAETLDITGSDAAHRPCAETVGTADVELFAIGQPVAIAIAVGVAGIDVADECGGFVEGPRLGEVGLNLDELRVGVLEEFLVLLVPVTACEEIA